MAEKKKKTSIIYLYIHSKKDLYEHKKIQQMRVSQTFDRIEIMSIEKWNTGGQYQK